MKTKRDGTEVLSLQELAKMQNELEEQAGELVAEVLKRAAAETVPPEEIWIQVRVYRKKLNKKVNCVPTPLKGLVEEVMEDIRKRRKRNENPAPAGQRRR